MPLTALADIVEVLFPALDDSAFPAEIETLILPQL